ncbi:Hypothetical_protein [Hexamita inflata]|uniref:Hypothetical_protein n=1 Tax=Hexamita inflata TaxID=28002 RepID=A0AA86QT10_9EUKA|nr:Hypothetical protein HINF_LOCUS46628 [Hexamita inflata]
MSSPLDHYYYGKSYQQKALFSLSKEVFEQNLKRSQQAEETPSKYQQIKIVDIFEQRAPSPQRSPKLQQIQNNSSIVSESSLTTKQLSLYNSKNRSRINMKKKYIKQVPLCLKQMDSWALK